MGKNNIHLTGKELKDRRHDTILKEVVNSYMRATKAYQESIFDYMAFGLSKVKAEKLAQVLGKHRLVFRQ